MTKRFTFSFTRAIALPMMAASIGCMGLGMAAPVLAQVGGQAASVPAAKPAVSLSSEARIERTETDANGKERLVLKKPSEVIIVPGDRVVFTLSYHNVGAEPAASFRATNPMPGAIQFLTAGEDWAELSVDGGKSWGTLESLTVTSATETAAVIDPATGKILQPASSVNIVRAAEARDVTHVRWVFTDPISAGAKGSVSYRGLVK